MHFMLRNCKSLILLWYLAGNAGYRLHVNPTGFSLNPHLLEEPQENPEELRTEVQIARKLQCIADQFHRLHLQRVGCLWGKGSNGDEEARGVSRSLLFLRSTCVVCLFHFFTVCNQSFIGNNVQLAQTGKFFCAMFNLCLMFIFGLFKCLLLPMSELQGG